VKDAVTATIVAVSATTGVRVTVVIVMIAATKANVKTANVRMVAMRVATNPAVIVRPRGAIAAANATNHHARTNRMRQSSPPPPAGHQSKHQRHRHATSNHALPWKHGHQRRAKMVKAVAAVVVAEVDVVAVDVS
jgi:hypothetical protein